MPQTWLFLLCELLLIFHTLAEAQVLRVPLKARVRSMGSRFFQSFPAAETPQLMLENRDNLEFYALIGMGTPPQLFRVIFDTGSANSWLPSSNCPASNVACQQHCRYKAHKSTSYVKHGRNYSLAYGNGHVSGYLSQDTIQVADVMLPGLIFGETLSHDQPAFSDTTFDGIVGLGFSEIGWPEATPFLELFCRQNVLERCLFTVHLRRMSGELYGGEITFGGIDSSRFTGTVHYVPLSEIGYWQFQMSGVSVGSGRIEDAVSAIVDTGTSLILMPERIFDTLQLAIGATLKNGSFIVSCDFEYLKDIHFHIGDKQFTLSAEDYVVTFDRPNETLCACGFVPIKKDFWVLGDLFLTRFYSVFDVDDKRIGFADAVMDQD